MVNGKSFMLNEQLQKEIAKGDLYDLNKPIHQECTNVYQAKDGRWFHLHGSMNAATTMSMVGVEEQDVNRDQAIEIYAAKVAQWDSQAIDEMSNDVHKQAGVICNTPKEFFASPQVSHAFCQSFSYE